MKYLTITTIIVFAFGTLLFVFEQRGTGELNPLSSVPKSNWVWPQASGSNTAREQAPKSVRAAGKIEGLTESVELRSRIAEQIRDVHVTKGMWVSRGDVLISLDSDHLVQERDLATAMLELAIAKRQRLEKGARPSEIDAARNEYESTLSPLWSAERALKRGLRLLEDNAIGQQDFDELQARAESLRASSGAAQARLKTLQLPAHVDDVAAAEAEIQAARSRLEIAQIRLERSQIKAPIEGCILDINARTGELASPDLGTPLIVVVDNRRLHAVAEVDEFDALKVRLGQKCEITADAHEGIIATGTIVEIEPQMDRKQIVSQWADERNDTFAREVRIALENPIDDLPIGLPIEIAIQIVESQ